MAPVWTSTIGAPRLARMLSARSADPEPGTTGLPEPTGRPRRTEPAYRSLADGIRMLVAEGRLPTAARLPAERELAAALSVSRTTVAAAFQRLRAEGWIASRRGSGSWTTVPAGRPLPSRGLDPLPPDGDPGLIDLGYAALPAPGDLLVRAFTGALDALPPAARTHGDFPAGLPALREALADRYTARGVPTMPEQIMVTTGAMGGLAAVRRLFAPAGERIAVEHPSYANVLQLMRQSGLRLVPVAMGEGLAGWDLPAWRAALRDSAPRLAYVVADYHNPTGALAPDESRRQLVAASRSSGTVLIVDETMADLCLDPPPDGPPLPVAALDPGGAAVVTVGSASKTFWAGLRIGWVRAAPELIRRLVAGRAHADLGSPVLEQLALTWLLSGDGWDEAVRLRRDEVRTNRDALVRALRAHLPDWRFEVPSGGLTLWTRTGGLSGSRIAETGERLGVRVPSGPRFGIDGAFDGHLRLPFTLPPAVAGEAVSRLAAAARMVAEGRVGTVGAPGDYIA
ncbi:PLP-dependent aminotransferase family protein [Streptomyces alkaliphilus]|uniref:MocR-like transcription factor YczR n=1 Tax=Streptomyces alkaliphilus TaxID=1472722 RepID=UPI00117F34A9|nr:PLP-dependent aminotransferase family protein [Streptomyces alkaliphilus]MQS08288.1 aminotransferase class I/II-fold pyridoxal phosphate-dependent enzyme [Streptomyces alkaliphilus]